MIKELTRCKTVYLIKDKTKVQNICIKFAILFSSKATSIFHRLYKDSSKAEQSKLNLCALKATKNHKF